MFPPTDNPAQRLLELLTQAKTAPNHAVAKVWSDLFGMRAEDSPNCYRILAHLNGLVDAVETRIRQIPGLNHDLFLRDLPTIRKIVCPRSLNESWHNLKTPLDHGVLTGLEFCANELGKHHQEDQISEGELTELRAQFSEIMVAVSNSDINSDLKLILFDLLTSAILAIDQYKILGNDGLKKAVAYAIGMLTLHKAEFDKAKSGNIVQKTFTAIKRLGEILTVAYRIKQLGSGNPIAELMNG